MEPTTLLDLPNELILHIFALFPTTTLLSLTTVSHHFHALILRLLQSRLVQAAELPDHTLLLECHHPSQKFAEPPLHCPYLGTPELDNKEKGVNSSIGSLSDLRCLYSSFQPRRRRVEVPSWRPPGDIPGSRTHPSSSPQASTPIQASGSNSEPVLEEDTVKQTISLEDHELFSQLCAAVNLVRSGPRIGLFRSFVTMDESVVRVWKDWLGRRTIVDSTSSIQCADSLDYGIACGNVNIPLFTREGGKGKAISKGTEGDITQDEGILWFDLPKHVGLRVNVCEKKWSGNPSMLLYNEDEVVNYEVEYKELVVRTSHLLLFLEKSLSQQDNSTGKATVFGSWDR